MAQKPIQTRGTLLGAALFSTFLPLLLGIILAEQYPDWLWSHDPFHSSIESLGAFSAITIAVLMAIMVTHGHLEKRYIIISAALIGMGTLDGLHGMLYAGVSYIWLHSVATMVGGVVFALLWLPDSWVDRIKTGYMLSFTFIISFLFGGVSVHHPELLPVMMQDGEFSLIARAINTIGGIGFLLGAGYFARNYLLAQKKEQVEEKHYENLIFTNHALLFGAAGLLFEFSSLWDLGWWWWHLLRLIAYIIVLVFFFRLFKENHHLLQRKRLSLEKATQAKDEFLASMSHELRTPLTSIIGNSELLLDGGSCGGSQCPVQDANVILRSIQYAGKNQIALVNDIRNYSGVLTENNP